MKTTTQKFLKTLRTTKLAKIWGAKIIDEMGTIDLHFAGNFPEGILWPLISIWTGSDAEKISINQQLN